MGGGSIEDKIMAFTDDAPVHLLKNKSTRQHRAAAGWHKIGNQRCYFRSEWERKFACYLECCKTDRFLKSWSYEPKTFWFLKIKRGVRSFKPDFKAIWGDGTIVWYEVKGWMDSKSKTKLRRMAKYYPKIRVEVVGSQWFDDFGRVAKATVPGWETKNV